MPADSHDASRRAVVLVEWASDRVALEALARRRGRSLEAEGVSVVAIGGAHGIGRFLDLLRRQQPGVTVAGLCDAGEERHFRHALERAGLGAVPGRAELERLGFYVCEPDLELELIRCLGVASVERILEEQGELRAFRTFQRQPAQRGRADEAQLRRFLGTRSGRKARYARLLVEALGAARAPRPLEAVLDRV